MSGALTLWEIEKGIAELFDALDEAETPEGRQACEQALVEYYAREVQKVDGIRALYKNFDMLAAAARQEAREQEERARRFEARCAHLKRCVQIVMEANGLKRIEGRTGRLLLKGNGGLAPLEVTDPAAVPDECCKYVGWIGGEQWRDFMAAYREWSGRDVDDDDVLDFKLERTVDNERLRAALKTCEVCRGSGQMTIAADYDEAGRCVAGETGACSWCGGSGMGGVPGARLTERGKHVEIK